MPLFGMTKEEHAQAVLKAIEETCIEVTKSKESALQFLKEAGIIQKEDIEPKTRSKIKKSK
jgi:hypothetical protein